MKQLPMVSVYKYTDCDIFRKLKGNECWTKYPHTGNPNLGTNEIINIIEHNININKK